MDMIGDAAGKSSAQVYSLSRPLHPLMPQTKQFQDLEAYAYQHSIQVRKLLDTESSHLTLDW
jgi:hypothetical protein